MTAARILKNKTADVLVVRIADSVQSVIDRMAEREVGAALVLNPDHSIAGLIRERDIMKLLAGDASRAASGKARDVMFRDVVTCNCGSRESELISLMARHDLSELPVVINNSPVGIISVQDVLRLHVEKVTELLKQIESEACFPNWTEEPPSTRQ